MPLVDADGDYQSQAGIRLRYFGHSAFELVSPADFRVLIDPFRNLPDRPWFLREFPLTESDLLLVTHDHFDHDAVGRVSGWYRTIRSAGHFQISDLTVDGYDDLHVAGHRSISLTNTIYVIECAGIRICHPGDNRVPVPVEIVQDIDRVDVLTVPVDGSCHLLDYIQVRQMIDQFQPRIVLPVHYYIDGLTTVESTLLPIDDWLASQAGVRKLEMDRLTLTVSDLPQEQEIWVLEPRISS